jgi:hypothetical protein
VRGWLHQTEGGVVGLISKKKSLAASTAAGVPESWQGDTWQYRAIALERVAGPSVEQMFNGRGLEGYEFVACVKHGRGSDGYAIFKRPLTKMVMVEESDTAS